MKKGKKNVIWALAIVALALIGWQIKKWYWDPAFGAGDKAPDFVATLPDNTTLNFADYRGKIVMLDFWGSWCGPCRKKNPDLVSLYIEFHGRKFKDAADFEIISVGIETDKNRWLGAIQRDGLVWPAHVSDILNFEDHVAKKYNIHEIPTQFMIDPKGVIMAVDPDSEEARKMLIRRLAL